MLTRSKPATLQVDCGATVSVIPKSRIGDSWLEPSNIILEMWNKVRAMALETCKLPLENPKTSQMYIVKFVVVDKELTPLLSHKAAEKMNFITVNYDKYESVSRVVEDKRHVLQDFPDVFSDSMGTYIAQCN